MLSNITATKNLLEEYKQNFDLELNKYLQKKVVEYRKISSFGAKFTKDLAEFTLRGGKRFRPALIYYAYKLFGGKNDKEVLKLSMFIEFIQSFLLIHDDIMDRSSLRRGGPTVHKVYERFSDEKNFNDDKHFGITMGILSGDLACQMAYEIISDSNFPVKTKNALSKLVSDEVSKVIFGQIHDILLNYDFPVGYKESDITKVHYYKTATYTFRLPLFAGAILAGAKPADLENLEKYAMPCGIAFQIRDDILGVFGKEEETGKETMGDLIEGKKTLLVTQAYKKATANQKELLNKYLGKKNLKISEAHEVRQIFKETKSLDYSKKACFSNVKKAKEGLYKISKKNKTAFNFLEGIADYMIVRDF